MAQAIKMLMRRGKNWDLLPNESKEALENVATLLGRILIGDAADHKHWQNAAGYLKLRANGLDCRVEAGISRIAQRLRPIRAPVDEDGAA